MNREPQPAGPDKLRSKLEAAGIPIRNRSEVPADWRLLGDEDYYGPVRQFNPYWLTKRDTVTLNWLFGQDNWCLTPILDEDISYDVEVAHAALSEPESSWSFDADRTATDGVAVCGLVSAFSDKDKSVQ